MKKIISTAVLSAVISSAISIGIVLTFLDNTRVTNSEVKTAQIESDRSFDRYSIDNLSKVQVPGGSIDLTKEIEKEAKYVAYVFEHEFDPTFQIGEKKKVTGRINLPAEDGKFPIILMIRGFVDQEIYETGMGTNSASIVFASNGYITIAPDFLGYAGSSEESGNIFETRFQTYTTAMSIVSSLQSIEKWDSKNIFIWAHSNGGQVALTMLTITAKTYPTTLWAPVTKPFPYSVLYYTDESADGGKYIRQELSKIEDNYDSDKYSFTNYLTKIEAPIQIHQGTGDDAVPSYWSSTFTKKLKDMGVDATYFEYPGADHNMKPVWDSVVERDLLFFQSHLDYY